MDMIISVSNAVRQQIVNLAPEARVMTIHNGISAAAYGQVSQRMPAGKLGSRRGSGGGYSGQVDSQQGN